jgi:hypothetical protein
MWDDEDNTSKDDYYSDDDKTATKDPTGGRKPFKLKNDDGLSFFVKLKKLVRIPLKTWEKYMNEINSYQRNIEHFRI